MNALIPSTLDLPCRRLMRAGTLCLLCWAALAQPLRGEETLVHSFDWSYRTAHDYVPPLEEGRQLTSKAYIVRPIWSYPLHTGINSSSAGGGIRVVNAGFEPTYGETAAAVVVDGVYILSWAQTTGDVTARIESLTDRYHEEGRYYEQLGDTYYRIDADWNTIAIDANTGEKLWQASQPSASINFQSSKRGHNGLDPVAGNGLYVTMSILGRVFAYDMATGELRWETTVGSWHEEAEAFKAKCLEERTLPITHDGPFGTLRKGAAMVGNTVIIPDIRGGLIGLNAEDGSQIWHLDENVMNRQGNPHLWEHEGKTYLITHTIHSPYNRVHLIDPDDGSIVWTYDTGFNPGKLLIGEDHVLLNPSSNRREWALLACYRITPQGLERQWRFPEDDRHRVQTQIGGSRSWERKGVIADGFLYMVTGQPQRDRRTAVYSLATGEELHRSDYRPPNNNIGAPFVSGDKLYWHISSTGAAGLYIYQRYGDGTINKVDEFYYRPLGISSLTTDYLHPTDNPVSNGRVYLRGMLNILAIDLREPEHPPISFDLDGAWQGFVRPVTGVLVRDSEGHIDVVRIEVPPRRELGVPGTTARRVDNWGLLEFEDGLKVGEAWETTATMHMVIFSWPAHIVMQEAQNGIWQGTWTRSFPGWDETLDLQGNIHESSQGGIGGRGWLTPWLENQPISVYSELEEGQQRIKLNMFNSMPRQGGDRQNMTLALDVDGERVISAVALGSRFNQSYHEVDPSGLVVSEEGISGTAQIILNGDPWISDTDWKNDAALLGRLTLNASFGEANDQGLYPVRGEWSIEWGIKAEISGIIQATITE